MKDTKPYLAIKDHSVSGETFQLFTNKTFGFLETHPQPQPARLAEYYNTEDYISHTDTKRNLFEKVYHFVRSLALKQKLNLINELNSGENKLLDIGCGTGDFLQIAQQNNWVVSGIEPNENARQIANSKTNNAVFDIERLKTFETKSFDVITLWHVLEHLPNLESQLEIFKSLLKENGTLVIAVPNHKSFDADYYKEFWAAYDVPRHLWHFDKNSMVNLFASKEMGLIKTIPMKFDAYYVSLLSEKYKSGTMNPIKSFWIGWRSNFKAKHSGNYSSLIYILKNK